VSVATTEGYAARPGGAQGKLLAEIAEDEAGRNLQIVLAGFRSYQDGIMPVGPGARELTEFFAGIDKDLAGHETAAPRVVASDQHVLNLLSKRAQVLHLATANYCWFTDPSRALCLKMAGTPPPASRWPGCATRPAAPRPPTIPATGPSGQTRSPAPPRSSARSAGPGQPSEPASRPSSTAPRASWPPLTPRPPRRESRVTMRTSPEQRRQAQRRIRAAADALLRGDIPPDGKCDVTTLARQAEVSLAALYRSYSHLKEEFERRLAALRAGGTAPDPRDARITRLKQATTNSGRSSPTVTRPSAI
jgi:hypothetical protein